MDEMDLIIGVLLTVVVFLGPYVWIQWKMKKFHQKIPPDTLSMFNEAERRYLESGRQKYPYQIIRELNGYSSQTTGGTGSIAQGTGNLLTGTPRTPESIVPGQSSGQQELSTREAQTAQPAELDSSARSIGNSKAPEPASSGRRIRRIFGTKTEKNIEEEKNRVD